MWEFNWCNKFYWKSHLLPYFFSIKFIVNHPMGYDSSFHSVLLACWTIWGPTHHLLIYHSINKSYLVMKSYCSLFASELICLFSKLCMPCKFKINSSVAFPKPFLIFWLWFQINLIDQLGENWQFMIMLMVYSCIISSLISLNQFSFPSRNLTYCLLNLFLVI